MDEQQKAKVVSALVEFVERASKKDATQAEIAALPGVARTLVDLNQLGEMHILAPGETTHL